MSAATSPIPLELMEGLIRNDLHADAARQLNQLLSSDPAARRQYLLFMEMHGTLHWTAAPSSTADIPGLARSTESRGRVWSWRWAMLIVIAAGLASYFAWHARESNPQSLIDQTAAAAANSPRKLSGSSQPEKSPFTRPAQRTVDLAAHYTRLKSDPRLIGLYDFQPVADPSLLKNLVSGADGRFENPAFEPGRFPARQAFRTIARNTAAAIEVPGDLSALTLAMWVNPYTLDGAESPESRKLGGFYAASLLMTDSQPAEGGYVHWQLNWAGQMSLSVNQSGPQPNYNTYSLLTKSDLGQWHHFAVTYDVPGDRVCFYMDGQNVYSEPVKIKRPLRIGKAHVGNWLAWDDKTIGRRLDGKIDELLIFKAALTPTEITNLYNDSKPSPTTQPATKE